MHEIIDMTPDGKDFWPTHGPMHFPSFKTSWSFWSYSKRVDDVLRELFITKEISMVTFTFGGELAAAVVADALSDDPGV